MRIKKTFAEKASQSMWRALRTGSLQSFRKGRWKRWQKGIFLNTGSEPVKRIIGALLHKLEHTGERRGNIRERYLWLKKGEGSL